MRIGIIGSGYVGTVTGAGFAALGNEVFFVDLDPDRVEALNRAESPIFEPGLDALLANNRGRYHATTDYGELLQSDISVITVARPRMRMARSILRTYDPPRRNLGRLYRSRRPASISWSSRVP